MTFRQILFLLGLNVVISLSSKNEKDGRRNPEGFASSFFFFLWKGSNFSLYDAMGLNNIHSLNGYLV